MLRQVNSKRGGILRRRRSYGVAPTVASTTSA